MAIQKNFVVRNGLEVNTDLILADAQTKNVGIGSTLPNYTLDVNGDIRSTDTYVDNDLILNGGIKINNSYGLSGYYLVSTGAGVTWSEAEQFRYSQSFVATQDQTTFNFSYNPSVGVDVFINGVRLSPTEYTANDGLTIVLNDKCFGDETVDLVAYSVTGIGAGITGITGISILDNGVSVGNDGNIISLDFVGAGVTVGLTGFGATVYVSGTGSGSGDNYFASTSAGIHTLSNVGIGTTNPTSKLTVSGDAFVTGVVTATSFVGDGSGLTGIITSLGVNVQDDGVGIGTVNTINFGTNLGVSSISAGVVTITSSGTSDSLWQSDFLGIHTTANVAIGGTSPTYSLQINEIYGITAGTVTLTSSAGISTVVDSSTLFDADFKTVEYTIHVGYGTYIQAQKILIMHNGINSYMQEYAIMSQPSGIVSFASTFSGSEVLLQAVPEDGVNGVTTYRFSKQLIV